MYCFTHLNKFYNKILNELDITIFDNKKLLYLNKKNFKNNYTLAYNNKYMILQNFEYVGSDDKIKLLQLEFNPLTKYGNLCSLLGIEDSIHIILSRFIRTIFLKVFDVKFKDKQSKDNDFDKEYINKLPNGDKYTINKWNNLCNIVSATSFSKNLISFSFEFIKYHETAQVNFTYPLYAYLNTVENNNIFGIQFQESEIDLLKKIYLHYIVEPLEKLFRKPIIIPVDSNKAPKFYVYLKIYQKIKELMKNKYNISKRFDRFDISTDMNNLNEYISDMDEHRKTEYFKEKQEIDKESYEAELQIRKESEPNWFLLKDNIMRDNLKEQQIKTLKLKDNDLSIEKLEKYLEESNQKKYIKQINTFMLNEDINYYKQDYQIMKNNQEWAEIFYWQNLVLDILRFEGGSLWFDTRIDKYCFRSKVGGKIVEKNKEQIDELLTRALKEKITSHLNRCNRNYLSNYAIEIVLVSKLKGINNQKLNINEQASNIIKILLFENEVKAIDDAVFEINSSDEFFKDNTNLFYTRNRFVPNEYLEKRYISRDKCLELKQIKDTNEQTFIEKFIYYLVKDNNDLFDYVMNWLAYYFQNLQKSKTALVLLGDQEVTQNIFWKVIIKEIFGKEYCTTINDEEQDTSLVSDIARDKLFFHISDIDDVTTKFEDKTLSLIVKDLLITPFVEDDKKEQVYIDGQMIITAKNPAPYLKKALSKCTVIEVSDMDIILEKLDLEDELELEDKIVEDLDVFTDRLLQYNVIIDNAQKKLDTEARKTLKSNITPNVDKDVVNNNINLFINAIKDKDLNYFENVKGLKDKKDNDIYEELKYAFEKNDGFFIGQDLYLYYNSIFGQSFKTNKSLMDKLKEKDDIFHQEVKTLKVGISNEEKVLFQAEKTTKETSYKELYNIKDYKLAKDITIPDGAIISSSQENIEKYNFANDKTLTKNREYQKKKKKHKKKETK